MPAGSIARPAAASPAARASTARRPARVGVAAGATRHRVGPSAARLVPPLGELVACPGRLVGVVRRVVEEHQAGPDGVAEVEDVQAGRALVEAIAVAARVEAEQAADQQADRRLVRHHRDVGARMGDHDLADHRQRPRQHVQAGFAAFRRERERVGLPRRVLLGELRLDLAAAQAFPAAVRDLAQAVAHDRRQAVRPGDVAGRVDAAPQRTAVDRDDLVVGEPIAEPLGLAAALVRDVDVDRAGEAILGAQRGGAVANEIEAGDGAHGTRTILPAAPPLITASWALARVGQRQLAVDDGLQRARRERRLDAGVHVAPLVGGHVRQRHPEDGGLLAP